VPRNGQAYPQYCNTQYKNVDVQSILNKIPDWKLVSPEYDTLAQHEWARHGTCSGLSPVDYFTLAINLAKPFTKVISSNTNCSNKDTLQKLFPNGNILYDRNGNLSGIDLFFDKTGKQIKNPIKKNEINIIL
jgi:ribonuclease I